MKLSSIHHVSAITADALDCIEFYAGVLGLDAIVQPTDRGRPDAPRLEFTPTVGGSRRSLVFTAMPGTREGRSGAGMVHLIQWTVAGADAIEFWSERLEAAGVGARPGDRLHTLRFGDPEGLQHELIVDPAGVASPGRSGPIRPGCELRGIAGVRAYSRVPAASADLLAGRLAFVSADNKSFGIGHDARGGNYSYDDPPSERGLLGAGTVHHVAWACDPADQSAWRQRVIGMGARVTPILERAGRRSFYFREPSGVLFEVAARRPRVATPEDGPLMFPPTAELRLPTAA